MKRLYLIAGGTDGYCSIQYTFNKELAELYIDKYPESYGGMDSSPESILVPDDATYESLGISYSIESDIEDEEE